MIIVLDDKLCTTDHIMLCVCTVLTSMPWSLYWMTSSVLLTTSSCVSELYLPACHDHCTGWQALFCWTCPVVWQYCTNQHVMIIVLDDKLCTTDHIMLCVCTVLTSMSWSLCLMTSSVLLTMSCCVSFCTYQYVIIIVLDDELCTTDYFMLCACTVLISMSWSLCWTAEHVLLFDCTVLSCISWSFCWMTSPVLLTTSCCVTVLYLPACHDHCAGRRALYYWPRSCCVSVLYLPECHDHCAWWQALYCWPCPAVCLYCTYQHVMIIVLDYELCTTDEVLPCVCTVLASMSWSLCWMMSSVLLIMSWCVSFLYLPACHNHCAGWWALFCWTYLAVHL